MQLGELVQVTDADALSIEVLAGAMLAAVEQSKKSPEVVMRWAERGQARFQAGGKRGKKSTASDLAAGAAGNPSAAAAPERAAD